MSVFELGILFDEDQARLGREILSGERKILFVEGSFPLRPKDGVLIIMGGDTPAAAIVTVGKIGLRPMTTNEVKRIEAVVLAQDQNSSGGIEAKIFTEIHVGDVEILPLCREEIVNEKYMNGVLKNE